MDLTQAFGNNHDDTTCSNREDAEDIIEVETSGEEPGLTSGSIEDLQHSGQSGNPIPETNSDVSTRILSASDGTIDTSSNDSAEGR